MEKANRNKFKKEYVVIGVIAITLLIHLWGCVENVIRYARIAPEKMQVVMMEEELTGAHYYVLQVDGEEIGTVDYNEYGIEDKDGKANPRIAAIIDETEMIIRCLILAVFLLLLAKIPFELNKDFRPFLRKYIVFLRAAGWLVIAAGFIPGFVEFGLRSIFYSYVEVNPAVANVTLIGVGAMILVFAETFKYGCELQEDLDLIA